MNSLAPCVDSLDNGWSVPPPAALADMAGINAIPADRPTVRYPSALNLTCANDNDVVSPTMSTRVSDEYATFFVVSPLETQDPEERELILNVGQHLDYLGIRELHGDICHLWWSSSDSAFVGERV